MKFILGSAKLDFPPLLKDALGVRHVPGDGEADGLGKKKADRERADVEWYIELFLGVHFAANWAPVH